ncbi:PLP-dependent aminotransferase family protein, partial [Pseudomonas aeruginosa]|nr:PLP-dependent aminotransferase family protein [Pseudomonas aeruginosa]
YFVWLPLAPEVRADAIAMALMRERIAVSHVPHAIRLALGSVDLETLRRALEAVTRVVSDQTDR